MQKIAKNAKNAAFFYKECKRTQRTPNSFIKNPNERRSKIVIFIIENFEFVLMGLFFYVKGSFMLIFTRNSII